MTAGGDSRLLRLVTLASQTVNVVIFDGSPDEAVSGRAWRAGMVGGCPVWARRRNRIDRFFALFGGYDHCWKSHQKDRAFARMVLQDEATE